jgi:hypothetical protein
MKGGTDSWAKYSIRVRVKEFIPELNQLDHNNLISNLNSSLPCDQVEAIAGSWKQCSG